MSSTERTLTIGQVRENPTALLNAPDEELRALFSTVLSSRQDVAAAADFVAAFRRLFEVAIRSPRDFGAESKIVKRDLRPCWAQHAPHTQLLPQVDPMPGGGGFLGFEAAQERSLVWRCFDDPRTVAFAVAAGKPTVWEVLWTAYQGGRVGRCPECGALFAGGRTGRRRVFCGDACRKRAHEITRRKH